MEVEDVKNIVDALLAETAEAESFERYFKAWENNECEEGGAHPGEILWQYMRANKFVPENLTSKQDSRLIDLLCNIALYEKDPLPLKYAIVVMHNRYILSDILEKAFMAHDFIRNMRRCNDLMTEVLTDFLINGINEPLYVEAFDETDGNPQTLLYEMLRAVTPAAEWFSRQYDDVEIEEVPSDFLEALIALSRERGERLKPALPKLTALSRYLYAQIGA